MKLIYSLLAICIILCACAENTRMEDTATNKLVQEGNLRFCFPGSLHPKICDSLIAKCKQSLRENCELLGTTFNEPITITFVLTRQDMKDSTGMAASGMAFPETNTLYCLADIKQAPIKHELMHMITMLQWGEPDPSCTWMNEGLATYAENNCNNFTVAQIYCYLKRTNKLISMDALSADFYAQPEMVGYHQSAYIVQFLLAAHGKDTFKKLWKSGFQSFKDIYGSSFVNTLHTMESEIEKKFPKTPAIDWTVFEKGCE
jgi:hypothetical protein